MAFVLFGDESKIYPKLIIKEMNFWRNMEWESRRIVS